MKTTSSLVVAAALAGGAFAVQAQENVFKIGVTRYDTHAKTNGVSGIGVPPGADVEVGDATTAILVYERLFGPNLGAELVMGIPPTIKAKASGSVAFLNGTGTLLSTRNWAPTLLVNYHFFDAGGDLAAVRRRRHQLHPVPQREDEPSGRRRRHGQLVGAGGSGRHRLRDRQEHHRLRQPGRGQGEEQGRGDRQHGADDDRRLPADGVLGGRRLQVLTSGATGRSSGRQCRQAFFSLSKRARSGRYGSRSLSGRPIFLPSAEAFSMSRFQMA